MNVIIDANVLKNGETGIEHYTARLIQTMRRRCRVCLLRNCDIQHDVFTGMKLITTRHLRFFCSRVVYALLAPFRKTTDIIHLPTPVAPFFFKPKQSKLVVTVHDLIPLTHPHLHTWRNRIYFRLFLPHLLRQADAVITVSGSTKKDIMRLFRIPASRVHVIPLASDITPTRERYGGLPASVNNYVLYVGTLEPRKNLIRLIDAFLSVNTDAHLVIVGPLGWHTKGIIRRHPRIHFTGRVSREALRQLYSHATVFAYPSLYEGFGIPILEAMRCGVPVLTSKTSSMPEVGGDAAVYVDPYDVMDIARHLERLLTNITLRKTLIQKGKLRVANYSWEKVGKQTLDVYRAVHAAKD